MDMAFQAANEEGANLTDDHIEGKIASLLLQLPDADEAAG